MGNLVNKLLSKLIHPKKRFPLQNKEQVATEGIEKEIEAYSNEYERKIDPKFWTLFKNICTKEQMYRLTSNYKLQYDLAKASENKLINNAIIYILKNDDNWIISLNTLIHKINGFSFKNLNYNTMDISYKKINDELIKNTVEVLTDSDNYFEIDTYKDLVHYKKKKNKICLEILKGKLTNISDILKKQYSEDELYKFALLEYKFGISLKEANVLLQRYGEDIDDLPKGILKDYLQLLSEIVDCDNIKEIVRFAIKNKGLKKPWNGFPNAREAEGKILNLFAGLYNKTLYKPKEEDKIDTEIYVDQDGKPHSIEVYKIKKDFRMCVRSENSWSFDEEFIDDEGNVKDYNEFYNRKKILNHGNSECYIGNENISLLKSDNIMVGYEKIYYNQLVGASPKVKANYEDDGIVTEKKGKKFSIYGVRNIKFRLPNQMIDNTRITGDSWEFHQFINFNEIYKDRIIVDKNGEIEQYKPSYIVWVEDDLEEERANPEWKINREKDKKWIQTKKAAAQLGVPIVVIDREYFAKREMKKTELMKKMIIGEEIDENEYSEFIEDYQNLTKPDIIKRLFTTIENNWNGMFNNYKLREKYFSINYRNEIRDAIFFKIDNMDDSEARTCLQALIEVSKKETALNVNSRRVKNKRDFYFNIEKISKDKLLRLSEKEDEKYKKNSNLFKHYLLYGMRKKKPKSEKNIKKKKGEIDR